MQVILTEHLPSDQKVSSRRPERETSTATPYRPRMLSDQCPEAWVDNHRKVAGIRVCPLHPDSTIETTPFLHKGGAATVFPEDEEDTRGEEETYLREADTEDHKDHHKATAQEVDTVRGEAILDVEEEDLRWTV